MKRRFARLQLPGRPPPACPRQRTRATSPGDTCLTKNNEPERRQGHRDSRRRHRRRLHGPTARDLHRAQDRAPGRGRQRELIAEVQQHLGDDRVRAVAMDATDGLPRGIDGDRHRRADHRPGRRADARAHLQRARRADRRRRAARRGRGALADPPRPAGVRRAAADDGDLRDRHQGDRPGRAVRAAAARSASSAAPASARRSLIQELIRNVAREHRRHLGVRRRRRAHARGQRPLARDDRVGRARQDGARLRPDERAARRAPARRRCRA